MPRRDNIRLRIVFCLNRKICMSHSNHTAELQHIHISAKHDLFDLKLDEVWQSRRLIWLFTKRSFVVSYKQTILGPLWLFLMPLLTSITYVILFGNIAKLSTDGVPQLLFYLTGNALWTYFSSCVTRSADTFTGNSYLFGKVYFPRLVMPLSDMLGNAMRFGIQMILVLVLLVYYTVRGIVTPHFIWWLMVPVLLIWLGLMGMGFGIIISSLTTKYRDLHVLVSFGVTLWMYATPVVYPFSMLDGTLKKVLLFNPVTEPMELFRYAVLGVGTISPAYVGLSLAVTAVVVIAGIMIFNRVERTFMDTV